MSGTVVPCCPSPQQARTATPPILANTHCLGWFTLRDQFQNPEFKLSLHFQSGHIDRTSPGQNLSLNNLGGALSLQNGPSLCDEVIQDNHEDKFLLNKDGEAKL